MKKLLSLIAAAIIVLSALSSAMVFAAQNYDVTYMIGDADCDEKVDILDAEKVQRIAVLLEEDTDGSVALRADFGGDGLDITDATLIQRYLAGFENTYGIGSWVNPPTEQPTEKPTEKRQEPTRDEYELPFVPA